MGSGRETEKKEDEVGKEGEDDIFVEFVAVFRGLTEQEGFKISAVFYGFDLGCGLAVLSYQG